MNVQETTKKLVPGTALMVCYVYSHAPRIEIFGDYDMRVLHPKDAAFGRLKAVLDLMEPTTPWVRKYTLTYAEYVVIMGE